MIAKRRVYDANGRVLCVMGQRLTDAEARKLGLAAAEAEAIPHQPAEEPPVERKSAVIDVLEVDPGQEPAEF